jgi:hypothetical protein
MPQLSSRSHRVIGKVAGMCMHTLTYLEVSVAQSIPCNGREREKINLPEREEGVEGCDEWRGIEDDFTRSKLRPPISRNLNIASKNTETRAR